MADDNSALDMSNPSILTFPNEEALSGALTRVLTNGDSTGVAFQFIATEGNSQMFSRDNILGKQFYTQEEIAEAVKRFDQLIQSVDLMINRGFTILRLEVATKEGLSGARIKFKTPGQRQHEHQYFHEVSRQSGENLGKALVPDDFLYDMKMFPSRYD